VYIIFYLELTVKKNILIESIDQKINTALSRSVLLVAKASKECSRKVVVVVTISRLIGFYQLGAFSVTKLCPIFLD
jgi:AAA15 family ATPase/GTPase